MTTTKTTKWFAAMVAIVFATMTVVPAMAQKAGKNSVVEVTNTTGWDIEFVVLNGTKKVVQKKKVGSNDVATFTVPNGKNYQVAVQLKKEIVDNYKLPELSNTHIKLKYESEKVSRVITKEFFTETSIEALPESTMTVVPAMAQSKGKSVIEVWNSNLTIDITCEITDSSGKVLKKIKLKPEKIVTVTVPNGDGYSIVRYWDDGTPRGEAIKLPMLDNNRVVIRDGDELLAIVPVAAQKDSKGSEIVIRNETDKDQKITLIPYLASGKRGKYDSRKTITVPAGKEYTFNVGNGKYEVEDKYVTLQDQRVLFTLTTGTSLAETYRESLADIAMDASGKDAENLTKTAIAKINTTLGGTLAKGKAIAVFPIALDRANAKNGDLVYEQLQIGLTNSANNYTVIEKVKVEQLLAEYDFQMSGLVSSDTKTLGQLLGADAVVFGSLNGLGKNARLDVYAVDTASRAMLAQSAADFSQEGRFLLLPIRGATGTEAETIKQFFKSHYQDSLIDATGDASLAPLAVNLRTATVNQYLAIQEGFKKYNANTAVSVYVQRLGNRNMLVASIYAPSVSPRGGGFLIGGRDGVKYLEYNDAIELWVKVPQVAEWLRRVTITSSRFGNGGQVWANFGQGVNRAEAMELADLLITDIEELQQDPAAFRIGFSLSNYTAEIEEVLATLSAADQTRITQNRKTQDARTELRRARGDVTFFHTPVFFDFTRNGNRTRLTITGHDGTTTVEYGSPQEFMRKMRVFSQQIVPILEDRTTPEIWDGFNASAVPADAPIPANFTLVKRANATPGVIPSGGFYIANADVTQQELQRLIGRNADIKNILDAIRYCNALSLQSGLTPAYTIVRDTVSSNIMYRVGFFPDANGYRLPTASEWAYARTILNTRETAHTLDKGGIEKLEYKMQSGGAVFTVGDTFRIVRPMFDYWKYAQ